MPTQKATKVKAMPKKAMKKTKGGISNEPTYIVKKGGSTIHGPILR